MAGPLDLVDRSWDKLKLSLPGHLVVSDPGVVADNIQVDLVHSSPLPAELGDNLPVRGDGDTKLEVRGICGHLGPGQVYGEVLAAGQVHGVPGRNGKLILASEVPDDGHNTPDGHAEPGHGVRGGPGVKLEVAESLTIQHKFVLNKELS